MAFKHIISVILGKQLHIHESKKDNQSSIDAEEEFDNMIESSIRDIASGVVSCKYMSAHDAKHALQILEGDCDVADKPEFSD